MSSSSAAPSPPAFDWHPKLTPYRLAFIVISGGLGVAKAVLVSRGQVAASTTVEWIVGIVVALSFQFLSECEYKRHRSVFLDWMFTHDCLNILKISVRMYRPNGENIPQPTQPGHQTNIAFSLNSPPIVTAYRLLVSTTVSVLGIAKLVCSYLGLSTAMNTFDWVVAVPLTLGLYYIGLYEEGRCSAPRTFFDIEYSSKAILWLYISGCVTLCLCWLSIWGILLREVVTFPSRVGPDSRTIWEACVNRALQWMGIAFCLGMLEIGAWGLATVLWSIIRGRSERYARSIHKYNDHVASLILYLLGAVFFMAVCLIGPFSAVQILEVTGDDFLTRPLCIFFAGMAFCAMFVPAGLAYAFLLLAVDVYNRAPLNFRCIYQTCFNS